MTNKGFSVTNKGFSMTNKGISVTDKGKSSPQPSSLECLGRQGSEGKSLNQRGFHAVDGREGVEEAFPGFAAFAADPKLAGRGAKIERGGFELIHVHAVAQDGEETFFLGQAAVELVP